MSNTLVILFIINILSNSLCKSTQSTFHTLDSRSSLSGQDEKGNVQMNDNIIRLQRCYYIVQGDNSLSWDELLGKNGTDLLHQLIFSQNKWNKLKKWNTHLSSSSPIIRQGGNLNMYFSVYLRTYQIHRQPLHETWYKISNLIIISSYIVHSENKYGRKKKHG